MSSGRRSTGPNRAALEQWPHEGTPANPRLARLHRPLQESGDTRAASLCESQAKIAHDQCRMLRKTVLTSKRFSVDSLTTEADKGEGEDKV